MDLLYLSGAAPLTPYFLYRRLVKKKRSAPWKSKLGYAPERPAGVPRVWIHAVSVGEAEAAATLVKALKQCLPDADIVVSTTTTTGQEVARKRYGPENVFFYPLDLSRAVKRALDRVKPTLLVLMELEVWPNMTAEAAHRGIPILVVNARVSERAARRYNRFKRLVAPAFRRVERWLAQTEEYAARLQEIGVDPGRIEISGNLKYDAIDSALPADAERAAIRAGIGIPPGVPVLVGGSTHPGEEESLLAAYAALRKGKCPALRLVLVPRHPERAEDVAAQVSTAGFKPVMFTQLAAYLAELPGTLSPGIVPGLRVQSAVLIVNTVGALKIMYKAADVAFVGGSLIPHGGQNVMEPCGLGLPVLHGPHMHNFNDAMEILRACNGSVQVSRESLVAELERVLTNRPAAMEMACRAREAFIRKQGATARAVECVREMLKRV